VSPPTLDPKLFSSDARELLALLSTHQVRYLIVGGEAVIYYGHVRTTGDLDFFYDRSEPNAKRLFAALDAFWSGHIPNLCDWKELTREGMILQFGVVPNRVDFINDIDGVSFVDAWPRRLTLKMSAGAESHEVFLISLADLIKNKEASGRPRDLEDAQFLRRALK
jgi:hypothetical protein